MSDKVMVWFNGHRYLSLVTDLNKATTARFKACAGKHTPSGDTVQRDFGNHQRILPVCANCGCPYGGPKPKSWSSM